MEHHRVIASVAAWLKEQRLASGISQEQLAVQLGRTQSWVAKVESAGLRADIEDILKFCAALNVQIDKLLELVEYSYEAVRTQSMWRGDNINGNR